MFNNEDAFSRGGTVDKFTSIFAMGNYIWFDRNSKSLLSLSNDIKSISDIGNWTEWQAYFSTTGNRLMADYIGKAIRLSLQLGGV